MDRLVVLLFLLSSFVRAAPLPPPPTHPLHVQTSDGVTLEAVWIGIPTPQSMGWVLLHGLGSIKEEWTPFAQSLAGSGQAVCLLDLRGHGKSGGQRDWNKMAEDVEPVLQAFSKASGIPRSRIGLGGASLGANLALRYAAAHPDVPATLLLSPGLDYAGIAIENDFARYKRRRLFMAASPGDAYALASVQKLARTRNDPDLRVATGLGAAHGVQMLQEPAFAASLRQWTAGTPLPQKSSNP